MSRSLITKVFATSLGAVLLSVVLFAVGVGVVLCTGTFTTNGSEITSFRLTAVTPAMLLFPVLGLAAMAVGCIGLFVAWLGALVNTARLPDKVWFVLLLALGLFSFGWIAVLVYLLAGPDGTPESTPPGARPSGAVAG